MRCLQPGLRPCFPALTAADEKRRYDLHRNAPDDDGYRGFLGRVVAALQPLLAAESRGLDFGSGPEPVLARMFEEAGLRMAVYDPFFVPDRSVLDGTYDFITATEVVEHLRARSTMEWRLSMLPAAVLLGLFLADSSGRPGSADLTRFDFLRSFGPMLVSTLSPAGDCAAVYSANTVTLIDVREGKQVFVLTGHTAQIHDSGWSRDGRVLAAPPFV